MLGNPPQIIDLREYRAFKGSLRAWRQRKMPVYKTGLR